ncbi:hypothetical protein NEUTE2DRAFT_35374, partial [Neurospora tetrasperma FGSC 2509]
VKKLSGGVYIYIDYRSINNATLKIKYLLLLIKETLNIIYKAKIFTKLNVITTFNRIRIHKGYK